MRRKIYDVSRLAELWQRLWCKILSSVAEISKTSYYNALQKPIAAAVFDRIKAPRPRVLLTFVRV